MSDIHPHSIWTNDQFCAVLVESMAASFEELSRSHDFVKAWSESRCVPHTKTMVRQAPMLGQGGGEGRRVGGFWKMAEKYVELETEGSGGVAEIKERCSFERYNDFQFYTAGDWYKGEKRLLVAAEVESKSYELLGEMTTLLMFRCPFKCLFVAESKSTLDQLNGYCADSSNQVMECGGTTVLVGEIPEKAICPDKWKIYRADVPKHGGPLFFRSLR